MNKYKNFSRVIFILLLIFINFLTNQCKNQSSPIMSNDLIRIGVILPLTGDAAIYGKAMKNGIELAFKESKIKERIQLLIEDDMGDKMRATNAGHFLINKNVLVIIGGAQSKTADALIPIIDKYKIPLVTPGASSIDFDKISTNFFRLWPSDSYDGKIMANFITNNLNLDKIAILYTNSKYGVGIKSVFEEVISLNKKKIVFSEPFTEGEKDFRTQLQKIRESKANALFIPGYFAEVSIILKQIFELNINIKIFGTSSFHDEKLMEYLGNAMDGVIFSFPVFDIEKGDITVKDFSDKYFKEYNLKPDVWAALSYDCFKVVENVIIQGAKSSKEIQEKMHKIKNFLGVSGIFSFDEYGNVIKTFEILIVKNGRFVKLL